jgi:diadenosine tetraphosphate (Ap4A) HIT family hydrolase
MNWLSFKLERDAYGEAIQNLGVPYKVIKEWCLDPQVVVDKAGKKGSCYDALEDLDAQPCLDKMAELWALNRPKPVGKVSGVEYDFFNAYADILSGKTECSKVLENAYIFAFLDSATGHMIVLTKALEFPTVLDMPSHKAAELTRDLPRLAKALKEASEAKNVNITTVHGSAGEVFHANFHIVPDGAKKLSADATKELLGKIDTALHPPPPLKKAKFGAVGKIKPETSGLNLSIKCVSDPVEKEVKSGKVYEVQVGDATGVITISLRADQKDLLKKDKTYELRNMGTRMIGGHIIGLVDKWGKIEETKEEIEVSSEKDISAVEYEQVKS